GRKFSYSKRDSIIYALGVGFGSDPANEKELRFVYEENLLAAPTMATVVAWGADEMERTGIDFSMLVAGEQRLQLHDTLPPCGEISASWSIREIVDKGPGKGALIIHEYEIADAATGHRLATLGRTSFARADGGFGGPSNGAPEPHAIPARSPDMEIRVSVLPQQALIYRLSGDANPLHVDPATARKAGFDRPILHGLGTYGIVGRMLLEAYCDYEPAGLKVLNARFSAPVLPGDEITLATWRDGQVVSFEARVAERKAVVLRNGKAVIG
ncbi:MAG: MaoC/PaaZ C-terminal domain-containing protein, partial [Flavobacteriaceae bacterium]